MRKRTGYVFHDAKEACWIARTSLTDETGRRRNIKRRAKNKRDAEQKLATLLRQIDEDGAKVADQKTFNSLADYYEEHYLKKAEYISGHKVSGLRDVARPKDFLRHFRNFFGNKKVREITYRDLLKYREKRFRIHTQYKRQRTVASWNREAAVLRRVLNIACQQGLLSKNPFNCGDSLINVSAERRREKILTIEEELKLLAACDSHPYRKPLKPLLIFLLDTGCRKSEALRLRWESVCLSSRVITIEGLTTKTLKTRRIIMTDRLLKELVMLQDEPQDTKREFVFGMRDNVRKSFASACGLAGIKRGGIDGLTLHSMRHTAATRLVKGSLSIHMVGRILGHTQPQTTYRYLSADLETASEAAAILNTFHGRYKK